jgi:hypothetical protein
MRKLRRVVPAVVAVCVFALMPASLVRGARYMTSLPPD